MPNKQTFNSVQVIQSLAPIAIVDGTDNGASADMQAAVANFQDAVFVINAGLWTDGVHTVSAEDSPDDSAWTAVGAGDLDGTFTVVDGATVDDQVYAVGYLGTERFVRVVIVTTGATTGAVIGATIILGNPDTLPVN